MDDVLGYALWMLWDEPFDGQWQRLDFHHHTDLDDLLGGNMEDATCAGASAGNLESSAEIPLTSLA